jgi:hypothetical protein
MWHGPRQLPYLLGGSVGVQTLADGVLQQQVLLVAGILTLGILTRPTKDNVTWRKKGLIKNKMDMKSQPIL